MKAEERATAENLLAALKLQGEWSVTDRRQQFGLISKMLLTYPVANASTESGKARGEAYLDAISDIPPHVLAEAIKRWNRGEAGEHDYRWAPAPAVLRQICSKVLDPVRDAIGDLEQLLSAVSIDRAMDPTPLDAPTAVPALRRMA